MLKVEEIRELIQMIDESSIDEFSYETEGAKLKLRKANETVVQAAAPKQVVEAEKQARPVASSEPTVEVEETAAEESASESTVDYDFEIVAPMVGTVYRASSPESDPYVKRGSSVSEGSIVCIIEAMKLFNEIESEVDGEIVEVLVEDGELVEYGQPLFRVKKG